MQMKIKANEKSYNISYNEIEGKVVSILCRKTEENKIRSYNMATEGNKGACIYLSSLSFDREHTKAARGYTGTLNVMTGEEVM